MQKYRDFRPTAFDSKGAFCPDQQDWSVLPVLQTRDSGPLDRSNFAEAVKSLAAIGPEASDGQDGDWEIHRFGHWGPGWIEVVLIRPDTPAHKAAEELAERLENYPVVNEEAYSDLQYQEYGEAWENYARREFVEQACRAFDCPSGGPVWDTLDDSPSDALLELFEACNPSGDWYFEDSGGLNVNIESSVRGLDRTELAAYVRKHRATRTRYPKRAEA